VRPLGFSLEDRYLRRAGLDYWPFVDFRVHDDWQAYVAATPDARRLCFSARAERSYVDAPLESGEATHLVFGGETRGLPPAILAAHATATYRIPIFSRDVRSLNLSNAVSIVVYEALRRRGRLSAG
jgi:tRNA (cytidine/uridine-2'-O-)-methyltransferase